MRGFQQASISPLVVSAIGRDRWMARWITGRMSLSTACATRCTRRVHIVVCGMIAQYSGGLDAPGIAPRFLRTEG
jgi:ABC-type dipeptide/oligopeptide/nickel transport system permease subunit